jgi:predicted lipoprotein with Yx(FWY)xxD motif
VRSALIVSGLVAAGIAMAPAAVPAVAVPAVGHRLTVGTRHGDGHTVLEAKGMFVYTHLTASGNDPGCNASCRTIWPVVLSHGDPRAAGGVKAKRLGVNNHGQATYFHRRLYYFAYDTATVSFGKHISSFGGKWQLVTTTGGVG